MRPDMISPRRLRPASDGSHSEPLFRMTREDPHRVLKGIVIPQTVRGQVNGVMPGASAPPKPQPSLWVMRKADPSQQEMIPGGLASGKADTAFDPEALKVGMKVELEHSGNAKLAREIAKDHLTEDPDYYKKLAKMEAKKAMGGLVTKSKEMEGKKRSWMPPTEYSPEAYGKPPHPEGHGFISGEPIEKIKERLAKLQPHRPKSTGQFNLD